MSIQLLDEINLTRQNNDKKIPTLQLRPNEPVEFYLVLEPVRLTYHQLGENRANWRRVDCLKSSTGLSSPCELCKAGIKSQTKFACLIYQNAQIKIYEPVKSFIMRVKKNKAEANNKRYYGISFTGSARKTQYDIKSKELELPLTDEEESLIASTITNFDWLEHFGIDTNSENQSVA